MKSTNKQTKEKSLLKAIAKSLNSSIHNTGNIARFVRFLTYKAELIGKRVIEIDEKFTTQECCLCGKRHKMPLTKRVMKCDCGNELDRDRNSAVNIMKKYLSQIGLCTAYQQFVGNLRHTGIGKGNCPMYSQEAPFVVAVGN